MSVVMAEGKICCEDGSSLKAFNGIFNTEVILIKCVYCFKHSETKAGNRQIPVSLCWCILCTAPHCEDTHTKKKKTPTEKIRGHRCWHKKPEEWRKVAASGFLHKSPPSHRSTSPLLAKVSTRTAWMCVCVSACMFFLCSASFCPSCAHLHQNWLTAFPLAPAVCWWHFRTLEGKKKKDSHSKFKPLVSFWGAHKQFQTRYYEKNWVEKACWLER